jgi:hypothetical protein
MLGRALTRSNTSKTQYRTELHATLLHHRRHYTHTYIYHARSPSCAPEWTECELGDLGFIEKDVLHAIVKATARDMLMRDMFWWARIRIFSGVSGVIHFEERVPIHLMDAQMCYIGRGQWPILFSDEATELQLQDSSSFFRHLRNEFDDALSDGS